MGFYQDRMTCSDKILIGVLSVLFALIFLQGVSGATPVMQDSMVLPLTAYPNDTLIGFCNATDDDLDNLTIDARWYLNDEVFFEEIPQYIDTGGLFSCSIYHEGRALCWGRGFSGQLGTGTDDDHYRPYSVNTQSTFRYITAGDSHACGLLTNGSAYCWGLNSYGEVGSGVYGITLNPVAVNFTETFKSITAGYRFTCGILTNGSAYCWGEGSKLGIGTALSKVFPTPVNLTMPVYTISAGDAHACALSWNGSAYCWGQGTNGKLGYGGIALQYNPAAVNFSGRFKSITAGKDHTCGILMNGSAYCWGGSSGGQLGNGETSNKTSPYPVNTTETFRSISAGNSHTCGVLTNGSAYCWGWGSLGAGQVTQSSNPYPVNYTGTMKWVAAGYAHTCGIIYNGSAYCWGDGLYGRLGHGNNDNKYVPTPVNSTRLMFPLHLSGNLSFIGNMSSVLQPYQNWSFECSAADSESTSTSLLSSTVQILSFMPDASDAGVLPLLASDSDNLTCIGTLASLNPSPALTAEWSWYNGSELFLSGNTSGLPRGTSIIVTSLDRGHTEYNETWNCSFRIYDGYEHSEYVSSTVYIHADPAINSVECELNETENWQSCLSASWNTTILRLRANCTSQEGITKVNASLANFTSHTIFWFDNATQVEGDHWIFDIEDYRVSDPNGLLLIVESTGTYSNTERIVLDWTPVPFPPSLPSASILPTVAYAGDTILGYCSSSQPDSFELFYDYSWHLDGELYTHNDASLRIEAGSDHSCSLSANGSSYCWGDGGYGQLGTGYSSDRYTPSSTNHSPSFVSITTDSLHSCGLDANGSAYCWGYANSGRLGYGGISNQFNPTAVNTSMKFRFLGAGNSHTCGLLINGSAYCWGAGSSGALGYGGGQMKYVPIAVNFTGRFKQLSAGNGVTCGLLINGSAYCWGSGGSGMLGYGGEVTQYVPIAVNTSLVFSTISTGSFHTCAISLNGSAYCWGSNTNGQLGTGDTTRKFVPTPVNTSISFRSLSCGFHFNCGVSLNGSAYCWGRGTSGQIGDGQILDRHYPTPVNTSDGFRYVSAGNYHSCGILKSGLGSCWGEGAQGKLGNGNTSSRYTPYPLDLDIGLYPVFASSTQANVGNLSSNIYPYQNWTLSCTASDRWDYSSESYSTGLFILADVPLVTLYVNSPADDADNLTCNATIEDGNPIDFLELEWYIYRNGEIHSSGNLTNISLEGQVQVVGIGAEETSIGDIWNCTVRARDDYSISDYVSGLIAVPEPESMESDSHGSSQSSRRSEVFGNFPPDRISFNLSSPRQGIHPLNASRIMTPFKIMSLILENDIHQDIIISVENISFLPDIGPLDNLLGAILVNISDMPQENAAIWEIQFSVDRTVIGSLGGREESVTMFSAGESWTAQPTTLMGSDEVAYFYSAQSPLASYFAVGYVESLEPESQQDMPNASLEQPSAAAISTGDATDRAFEDDADTLARPKRRALVMIVTTMGILAATSCVSYILLRKKYL
jgi:alpha-tubulin suppressor-like RCC1 family protein